MNSSLWREVFVMALDTLRTNKMRSALTILGVVIGITSIVGMTSLIRGFDESLRGMIRELGPNTIILSKASAISLAGGADIAELMRRPNLTVEDAKAIEKLAPSVGVVDIWMGQGLGVQTAERVSYGGERTPTLAVLGATEQFAAVNFVKLSFGRFFTESEVLRRRRVVVLGNNPYQALFAPSGLDPIGKKVRIGAIEYTVVGILGKRPSPFPQADDFVVIPQTTHQVVFSTNARRGFGGGGSAQITIVPVETATRDQAVAEVEEIMRIRHGLKLDEPNDFEIGGQDAILRLWDQISQAVFLALVAAGAAQSAPSSSAPLIAGWWRLVRQVGDALVLIQTASFSSDLSQAGARENDLGSRFGVKRKLGFPWKPEFPFHPETTPEVVLSAKIRTPAPIG